MRICYIALTCEAYIPSRVQWQRNSWIRAIDPEDTYLYLTGPAHSDDPHILGFNTGDDYLSCPEKYKAFFQYGNFEEFDWYFFVDDDTFVFPDRLKAELAKYDPTKLVYFGSELNFCVPYMSGGAGFALSQPLYKALRAGHQDGRVYQPDRLDNDAKRFGDVTLGAWLYNLGLPLERIHCPLLCGVTLDKPGTPPLETAITSHYVDEARFKEYSQYLHVEPVYRPFRRLSANDL